MTMRFWGLCLITAVALAQAPERKVLPQTGLYKDYAESALKMPVMQAAVVEAAKAAGLGEGTTHFLAQDLTAASVTDVAVNGRVYVANERIGDPAGVQFYASNNNGVYDIGDKVPMIARTRLVGHTPLPAKLRILLGDAQVAEADGYDINF